MIVKDFKGYIEGQDISTIPNQHLAYPSKNVLVHKGKVFTRLGIRNDGVENTEDVPIHSEFVWKDSPVGQIPMRCKANKLQIKWLDHWYTIFSGFDADTIRCRFATWVDSNGVIIKKRLFIVDGSEKIYEWSGAIATIASYNAGAQTITIDGTKNLNQMGFDDGSGSNYTIEVLRLDADDDLVTNEEKITDDDATDQVMHITVALVDAPAAGDLLIAKPIANTPASLGGSLCDEIYVYKNHVVVWNFESVEVKFSHIETKLDFTVPGSPTALTPINIQLDGFPTAIISKKENGRQVLWISTEDHWFKLTKLDEVNAYGQWIDVEKVETAERTGALPYAVAKHKNDIIYMGQDQTLSRITSLELTGTDDFILLSDTVEDLLLRLDMTEIRIYYNQRFIYILLPAEDKMLMVDMVEEFFQPPQTMAISCMSIIDGVKFGHSSARDETFYLFSGRNDLGSPIEAIIALPFSSGTGDAEHEFRKKQVTTIGTSGRMTVGTSVALSYYHETDGARQVTESPFNGGNVKFFDTAEDDSFATHPFATRSFAGDESGAEVKRFYCYDKLDGVAYLEARPIWVISPLVGDDENPNVDMEFQLIAFWADEGLSTRKLEDELFITR